MINIVVNNKKELEKLYKKLFIYKSVIFSFCKFNIKGKYEEVKIINNALNIKSRRKRIKYIYDKACEMVDDNFKDIKNPCGFKCNKCYTQYNTNNYNGCCRLCRFQSNTGCLTKNLTCKLFYCTEVRKRHKFIEFDDLKILKLLSIRQRIILKHDYFSSEKEVLSDLYFSSLILFSIRLIFRMLLYFYKRFFSNKH